MIQPASEQHTGQQHTGQYIDRHTAGPAHLGAHTAGTPQMCESAPRASRFHSIHEPLPVDEDGFITDPHLWSETFACLVTALDSRGTLSEEHMAVIYYLREHFLSCGALPPVQQLCHAQGMPKTHVKQLFGTCRAAWRTAGLPNPGPEALAYMS